MKAERADCGAFSFADWHRRRSGRGWSGLRSDIIRSAVLNG